MSSLSRPLSLAILLLSVTTAIAADPAPAAPPAPKTPEAAIASRRKVVQNGAQSTIYYGLDGLNPIEAVAYRRLEFLENEVERNHDEQHLIRLRVQNDTRAETMATALASYSNFGVYRGRQFSSSQSYGSSDFGSPATALANFEELKRAYLDVLDVERVRLGLPRLFPGAPVAPGAAAPGAAEPAAAAVAVPMPAAVSVASAARPAAAMPPVTVLAPQQAAANALSQFEMVVKALNQGQTSNAPQLSPSPMALAGLGMTIPPSVPRVALSNSSATKVDDRDLVKPTLAAAASETSSSDGLLTNSILPAGIVPAAATAVFFAVCLFRLRRSPRDLAASNPSGLMVLPEVSCRSASYSSSLTGSRLKHTYER
jgi:hypothetical protein